MARTPKTGEEIEAEIKALNELKPRIQHYSLFGDNWAKIDMEIRVLEEEMDEDELNDYLDKEFEDEAIDKNEKMELWSTACAVIEWMEGTSFEEEPPSHGWRHCLMPEQPVPAPPVLKKKPNVKRPKANKNRPSKGSNRRPKR